MRILLVYPGHSHSTLDVARGYHGALKRTSHQIFHINHHHNIGFYKHACKTWEEIDEGFKSSMNNILWLASNDVIAKAVELLPLDLILMITGTFVHPRAYACLRYKLDLPLALILTESPYQDATQGEFAGVADVTFTNDRASMEYLKQFGPISYLPHSWDPKRHHPRKVGKDYQYDVFFLGTMFKEREDLFEAINWDGIHKKIDGVKVEELEDATQLKGMMSNEEVAKYYCGSKITLNPHRGRALTLQPHSLGPRTYEVAACGAFQLVSNNRAELHEVFGDVLPTFEGAADLEDKIHYFLAHDRQREFRAEESRRLVRECTFDHRLKRIILPKIKEVLG